MLTRDGGHEAVACRVSCIAEHMVALRPLALDTELFCELVRAGAPHVVSKESAVSSLKAESLSDAIARFCNSCLV